MRSKACAVSRDTVRRLRRALGLPPKRRRRPRQHRARRPRHPAMGSLVLIDGSPFDWLGTGTPLSCSGHRRRDEHRPGAAPPARRGPAWLSHPARSRLAARHGLPVTLYGDRLGVFVRNDAHWSLEEELQGAQHPTHFGQILRDLGIGYIAAHSPQAKGRVERLWATLQDRLVAELRLHGIHTVDAAAAFLPTYLADHNRRLPRPRPSPTAAWRRPAARSRRPAELPLHPRRWLATTPSASAPGGSRSPGPARPLLRRLPRRGARMSRWPAARRLSGPPPGHGAAAAARLRPGPPSGATSPRLLEAASEEGGRHLPLRQNGRSSAIAALTALAQHLRRPARPHPWRRTFSRRQRARQPPGDAPHLPHGRTFSLHS